MLLQAVVVWFLIASAEVLQGALRVRFLTRRLGDLRARQLGVVTGSLLILAIAWYAVPYLDARSTTDWWSVGAVWLVLMLALDLYFGRIVMRSPWTRIAADFDPRRGGFLGFGMLVLLVAPVLVARLQHRI